MLLFVYNVSNTNNKVIKKMNNANDNSLINFVNKNSVNQYIGIIAARFLIAAILFFSFGQEALNIYAVIMILSIFFSFNKIKGALDEKNEDKAFSFLFHSTLRNSFILIVGFVTWGITSLNFGEAIFLNMGFAIVFIGIMALILEKNGNLSREHNPEGNSSGSYLFVGFMILAFQSVVGQNIGSFYFLIGQHLISILVIMYIISKRNLKEDEKMNKYIHYCLDSISEFRHVSYNERIKAREEKEKNEE